MVISARRLLAAVLIGIFTLVLSCGFSALSAAKSSPGYYTVVLDAGHGGIDPGVLGKHTGIKESDINLAIVKILQNKFENAGFRVVLTRENESGLYGLPTEGFKKRDMQKRKEIALSAEANVLISVHQNSFVAAPERFGGQVFFDQATESGKPLAIKIQQELNGLSGRNIQSLGGEYFMLECTDYPSVIVECGFLSNAEEEKRLSENAYREKIADAIFRGTVAWLAESEAK